MIRSLIESAVIVEVLDATTKDEALSEMVQRAVDEGRFDATAAEVVLEKVRSREAIGSTGIGNGIAVPHVKVAAEDGAAVAGISLVLARSHSGLDYDAVDGRPVHTLFLIVAPADAADDHLTVLRWVSSLARNADFRRFVLACDDAKGVRELLVEMTEQVD